MVRPAAPPQPPHRAFWRTRRGLLTLVGGGLLLYYAVVMATGLTGERSTVGVSDATGSSAARSRVELVATVQDLDVTSGVARLEILPVPHGRWEEATGAGGASGAGALSEPLSLVVRSPGRSPVEYSLPAHQVPAAVGAVTHVANQTRRYPFDRAEGVVSFDLTTADGRNVPLAVHVEDSASSWRLSARVTEQDGGLTLDLGARRAFLVVALALFALCAIAVAATISVAVIGTSLTDGEVAFSEVIWLGAMLVAIPAMRNSMPDVPPMGTALDIFVFLPAVGVVALALVASTFVLAASRNADDDKEWDEGWDSPEPAPEKGDLRGVSR
jgi:hypothetical protein